MLSNIQDKPIAYWSIKSGYDRIMHESEGKDSLWTLPNIISAARLVILLPWVVFLLAKHEYLWALIAMVLLGLTDWLDGFLARRLDQVSEFGKAMDPIADRISVIVIGIALMTSGIVPPVFVILIVATDVSVALVALVLYRGNPDIPVTKVGKVRTAILLLALPTLILAAGLDNHTIDVIGLVMLGIGVLGHVAAGIGYIREMYVHRPGSTVKA